MSSFAVSTKSITKYSHSLFVTCTTKTISHDYRQARLLQSILILSLSLFVTCTSSLLTISHDYRFQECQKYFHPLNITQLQLSFYTNINSHDFSLLSPRFKSTETIYQYSRSLLITCNFSTNHASFHKNCHYN